MIIVNKINGKWFIQGSGEWNMWKNCISNVLYDYIKRMLYLYI